MHTSLIWAMGENRLIGRDNTLPWRLPKDMRHFMAVTMGKPVLMGRKTFESMKAALPGRTNIVLTRDTAWQRDGAKVVHDLQAGLDLAEQCCLPRNQKEDQKEGQQDGQQDGQREVMVIGGADIYALTLPIATRLYITHVHASPEGDVFFPEFDLSAWQCLSEERFAADDKHSSDFTIALYERP